MLLEHLRGQRPHVNEMPAGLEQASPDDLEAKRTQWRLSREIDGQRVAMVEAIRGELREIIRQIPGTKEAALEAICTGHPGIELPLPDGNILTVSGSHNFQLPAGSSSERDEFGDYIPGTDLQYSSREAGTYVQIKDGAKGGAKRVRLGISLETRVRRFTDGRILSQEGQISARGPESTKGFGFFSTAAPVDIVLEEVDKVEDALSAYIPPQ